MTGMERETAGATAKETTPVLWLGDRQSSCVLVTKEVAAGMPSREQDSEYEDGKLDPVTVIRVLPLTGPTDGVI